MLSYQVSRHGHANYHGYIWYIDGRGELDIYRLSENLIYWKKLKVPMTTSEDKRCKVGHKVGRTHLSEG